MEASTQQTVSYYIPFANYFQFHHKIDNYIMIIVLGGCGILNSVSVLVFSHPKTSVSVSGSVLALKYKKIGKVRT